MQKYSPNTLNNLMYKSSPFVNIIYQIRLKRVDNMDTDVQK